MSIYRTRFDSPNGPGDGRPTASQIIKDNGLNDSMRGKIAVITGGHAGIGLPTTHALLKTGMKLYLTTRDVMKAQKSVAEIGYPNQIEIIGMNQASFESVHEAAKEILRRTNKVNVLINNAGVMAIPALEVTIDGHEKQFQTNHLSHFLLFLLLKPALLNASSPSFASRVVNVSASAHRLQGINHSDNYNWQNGGYTPWGAYAQSKTANIYMANEIERRFGARGIHALSLHPGLIFATSIGQYVPKQEAEEMGKNEGIQKMLFSPEQGAATTVLAAVAPEWEGKGGKYLVNCAEADPGPEDHDIISLLTTNHTYNSKEEARLWGDSEALVGLMAS